MPTTPRFAINRVSAPALSFAHFAALAQRLGVDAIEIRNDLAGVEINAAGASAASIKAIAADHGLTIRSINALQRFDQYDSGRQREALALAGYARDCGAQALVLCPTNSPQDQRSAEQRHRDLVLALSQLGGLLQDHGLGGLIEPLGFESCALRRKSQAVRALQELGGGPSLRLLHDSFHHHLAGEDQFFPELTGLVHISGVEEVDLDAAQMHDHHRVLVGPADRLRNLAQLRRLLDSGYAGHISFESFAPEIGAAADIEQRLRASMAWLAAQLAGTPPRSVA